MAYYYICVCEEVASVEDCPAMILLLDSMLLVRLFIIYICIYAVKEDGCLAVIYLLVSKGFIILYIFVIYFVAMVIIFYSIIAVMSQYQVYMYLIM